MGQPIQLEDCSACEAPGMLVQMWVYETEKGFEAVAECGHCKRLGPRTIDKISERAALRAAALWNAEQH